MRIAELLAKSLSLCPNVHKIHDQIGSKLNKQPEFAMSGAPEGGMQTAKRDEQQEFVEAMAEAEKFIQRTQAALQRAKSMCHGDIYEHLDVISKRAYEMRVRSEWLRLVVLGAIKPAPAKPHVRQSVDRRSAIDRRVEGMRKEVLDAT
jgi:hypothetical protein